MPRIILRHKSLSLGVVIIIILAIMPFVLPSTTTLLLTRILIMAMFATSLNLMIGYGGMLPLGQAVFLGFGAYAYGIMTVKGDFSVGLAVIVSLIMCFVVNVIIGYLCLRGESLTFGLLHFAFNIQLYIVVNKLVYFTGGNSGIGGVPRPEWFNGHIAFFFFVLAVVLICYILMKIFVDSPTGKVLQGLRENEERLTFLGINTRRYQLVVFVISGVFAGLAGILLAMLNTGVFPEYMSPIQSAQAQMMCLIGGMSNFMGPSLGAILVVVIGTEVSNFVTQWQGILGVIIVIGAIGFRGGILGRRRVKAKAKEIISSTPNVPAEGTSQ